MLNGTLFPGNLIKCSIFIGCFLALLGGASGCMLKKRIMAAQRSVIIEPVEVVAERDLTTKWRSTLGVLSFTGPAYAGHAGETLSRLYFEKLLENGPFQQTFLLHQEPRSDEEALRIGRDLQCDAVLIGAIDYLLDSSGASPTALELHIRILEVKTGLLLGYFRQRGESQPGSDVDLFWNIVQGDPSVRIYGLAQRLAEQASQQLNSSTWKPFGN
jgi:hypothetical protein